MKKIINWLLPKEKKLFEFLRDESENTLEAANELKNFVNEYSKIERSERIARIQSIKKLEEKVDELKIAVVDSLRKGSMNLAEAYFALNTAALIEQISDQINIVASRFVTLSIERIDDYIIKQVDILYIIVEELNKVILNLKKDKHLKQHVERVRLLEQDADDIYNNALSDLFHYYKNSIDIIKYKEIYELFETLIDKCADAANVIENMIDKHS